MSIQIPDAAVEAVKAKQGGFVYRDKYVREQLEAAYPHLAPAAKREALADLRERGNAASIKLSKAAIEASEPAEKYRLSGNVEGVNLLLSYIDDAVRMLGSES